MLFLLAGCADTPAPSVFPTATATLVPSATFTLAPTPTLAPAPSATAIRTPPALPALFQSLLQRPVDPPHTYIANTCQYLQDKWSSQNSLPGTIVIPLMFHSIMKPGDSIGANQISQKQFTELMGGLESRGFEAITTAQLADFLEHNARIPARSVLLIVDDRHHAEYFNQYFRPWWVGDKWPVVNAWISASRDNLDAALWTEQEGLNAEGWITRHTVLSIMRPCGRARPTLISWANCKAQSKHSRPISTRSLLPSSGRAVVSQNALLKSPVSWATGLA
jgi:hypothetical protein